MRVHIHIDQNISFEHLREKLQVGVNKGVKLSTELVTDTAKTKAPVRYGNLRRSIIGRVEGSGVNTVGKIVQDQLVAKYGKFVEYGTGIYGPKGQPIKPVNAKMLSWKGAGGKRIFARSVKGMRPRPYMKPALRENTDNIKRIMEDEIKKAFREG